MNIPPPPYGACPHAPPRTTPYGACPHAPPCRWIIWDWNGTLLDDTSAAFNAFNAQLTTRGFKAISLDFYRAHFAFPVKPFYALCGIDLAHEDWDRIAREYHAAYAHEAKALNREAIAALERVKAAGVRQCVLSALRQDLLEAAIEEAGIRDYFEFVYGTDNLDGGSKLARAKELVEVLCAAGREGAPRTNSCDTSFNPVRGARDSSDRFTAASPVDIPRPALCDIVMIGDAVHDKEVSDALGVRCVLTAQGGHSAERLRAVAPTGDTLLDAVTLALQ